MEFRDGGIHLPNPAKGGMRAVLDHKVILIRSPPSMFEVTRRFNVVQSRRLKLLGSLTLLLATATMPAIILICLAEAEANATENANDAV